MADLSGQTIASSYEQLLSLPDGGGNANTLVAVTDGDAGTTFGIKLATNKVEIIPGSNDTNAFEVSQADGTAVLTVDSTNARVGIGGAPAWNLQVGDQTTIFGANLGSDGVLIAPNANNTRLIIEGQVDASIVLVDDGASSDDKAMMLQTVDGTTKFRSIAASTAAVKDNILCLDHGTGNVGIGSSSPDEELEVFGASDVGIKLRALGTNTSANTDVPAISFQSHQGDGVTARASISADRDGGATKGALIFKTRISDNITEAMRIDSSGNIVMGTANADPHSYGGKTLTVETDGTGDLGNISIAHRQNNSDGDGLGDLIFSNTASSGSEKRAVIIRGLIDGATSNNAGGRLQISTKQNNSTSFNTAVLITNEGSIQNGSTTGFASLYPAANSSNFVSYGFVGDQNTGMYRGAADTLRFATGGSQRVEITNTGMGINKTSPLTKLHVVGTTGNPASSGTTPTAIARFDSTFNAVLDIGQGADPYPMWIQAADRSNLAQTYEISLNPVGGNVGVGILNPSVLLHCRASGTGSLAHARIDGDSGSGDGGAMISLAYNGSDQWRILARNQTSVGNSQALQIQDGDGNDGVFLNQNATSFSANSDERMKENIVELENATDKLNTLRCVNYNMKHDESNQKRIGLIAQDVYKIYPEATNGSPDNEYSYSISNEGSNHMNAMGLKYTELIAPMIKAIQELSAKVEELENKLGE